MAEPFHPPSRRPFCWIFGEPVYLFHDRTGSDLRRERGLPTVHDLRQQARRRIASEAEAAAAAAAAAAAEAEELNNKSSGITMEVENLNPSASVSTAQVIGGGASFLNKDLGGSSGTTLVENLTPAEADLSGTEAKLKGKSILKDLGESSETVDEYLNPAANPTAASSGTRDEVKGKFVLKHSHKDLSESSTVVDFLIPTADSSAATDAASGTKVEVKGNSVLKRPHKDLGESIESMVEYPNLAADSSAATDAASVIETEVEGGSVRKRPRKDLS